MLQISDPSQESGRSLVAHLEGGEQTMRLTQASILAARYSKEGRASDVRWDDAIPGFGVRIYPTGKKSFVLKYRIHGRQRFMVIGSTNVMTLDDARNRARRLLVKIIDKEDPQNARSEKVPVFSELAAEYIERHAIPFKKTGFEDERRIKNFLLPIWKNRAIKSITQKEVSELHHKLSHMRKGPRDRGGKYTANRVRELVQKMFSCAVIWGMLDHNHPNPAKGITENKEVERARFVTAEELVRLGAVIAQEKNVYIRAAVWLYILTGLRKMELLGARWTDIDFDSKRLLVPSERSKNGLAHHLPLNAPAMEILSQIPRVLDNPFIFVSPIRGRHLVAITNAWHKIRIKAGLQDVRLHDLRRTTASWLAMNGHSLPLIGRVLNQSSEQATAVYARVSDSCVRDALEQHGDNIRKFM